MMNMKLKKVYQVSKKADKPRLFLQHIVCEAAGFEPGEPIYIRVNEEQEEILIQNHTFQEVENVFTVHVSSRKNRVSGKERPLVDTAGDKYSSFLDIKQKIEVTVFRKGPKSQIFIKPLRYSLFEIIPNDTTSFIARLEASNSTGNVTIWNKTPAPNNTIPNKSMFDIDAKIPINTKIHDKLDEILATGTNLARNVKNEYASLC